MTSRSEAKIDQLLEELFEVRPPDIDRTVAGIQVAIGPGIRPLSLSKADLRRLTTRRLPQIPGLTLIEQCGFAWQNYAEFFVSIWAGGDLPEDHWLKFRIGSTNVTVGQASSAIGLVVGSVFLSEEENQFWFDGKETIRLYPVSPGESLDVLQQALFYLNASHLRPLRGHVVLSYLRVPSRGLEDSDLETRDVAFQRTRIRSRPSLRGVAPLLLFNQAVTLYEDTRFLGFYRVLEYFFHRAFIAEVGRARSDQSISNEDLVVLARSSKELAQLSHLCHAVLTSAGARRLAAFAARKGLMPQSTPSELPAALYAYRNSLVHAKELEISRTVLPDPYRVDTIAESWAAIAEELAARAINRLNSDPHR
jgi:hypothetical protein